MTDRDDAVLQQLKAMHETQLEALAQQREHLALFRDQVAATEQRLKESMQLQQTAVRRQAQITRLIVPLLLGCLGLIVYLVVRYL